MSCAFLIYHGHELNLIESISTKLDAEKRLALQEEKQALEAKLLDVYAFINCQCQHGTYIRVLPVDQR